MHLSVCGNHEAAVPTLKSVDDAIGDAVGVMPAILAKNKVRKQHGQYFESLEAVRAALTETRFALLRLIRERAF